MDVRCERCSAEYALEEGRVTEAGLSVKCGRCGNIFIVRKKAGAVTEPIPAASETRSARPSVARGTGGLEGSPQWRVRQASGNLITFRELTTLQRWIVERKLSRDDEISLTGENWKRLGGISELSAFFQVVDEAQRAAPLEQPFRESGSATAPKEKTGEPNPPGEVPSVVVSLDDSSPAPHFETTGMPGLDAGAPKGPNRSLSIVLLLALLGGVSYLAYRYFVWVPQWQRHEQLEASQRSQAVAPPRERDKPDQLASQAAVAPQAPALTAEGESAPTKADEAEPARPPAEAAPTKPAETFDSYMNKAVQLREREQPRDALQLYRKAHELEPARPEPLAGRGLALLDLGQTAAAITAFEQALEIDPRFGLALMGLAEAYRAEGKKEQAIRYYEEYLADVPDGPKAQVAKAAIKALQE
jgi:predicted Zn finger-like uncharacterized protein